MNSLDWLTDISSWHGHINFAFDLVANVKPNILVELGTHKGDSYFAFCNAVLENNLNTKCFAVDTWLGDNHSGKYGEDVFKHVSEYNRKFTFSKLLRMTFDEAKYLFDDNSIDVLHIDGFHTYEAVSHDFYNWLPKVNENGVILLHDIEVRRDDFGVYKLWSELKEKFEYTFEFKHSFGLGVIFLKHCDFFEKLKNKL
ncbi:MAG: class I SAM-dependent methyltransferase [Nanopusillaceae archaeon]